MFKSSSNNIFLSTLSIGLIISISSNNWFGPWIGLEHNLLSFIPLMINKKNSMFTEGSLKYFLVQALVKDSSVSLFSVGIMSLSHYTFKLFFYII